MPDKHPPGVTVQHFTKEQKKAGVVPGVQQPDKDVKAVIMAPDETGNPPPGQVSAGEVSGAADIPESAPPTQEQIPQVVPETPSDIPIESNEVTIRGAAAIEMAKMLGLEEVWNVSTGEPLPLAEAAARPELAIIDFAALRESIEEYDPNAIEDMISALPAQMAQTQQPRHVSQVASPPVTVKQYPGLVRVEVQGPVRLRKSKEGNVRILQVAYRPVEPPAGVGNAQRTTVQAPSGRVAQPNPVTMKRRPPTRTIPRRETAPAPVPPPPEPPEVVDDFEDQEF